MNNSATANTFESLFELFNFDFTAPQLTQDADLIRQLPFIPKLKEILMIRQVHGQRTHHSLGFKLCGRNG